MNVQRLRVLVAALAASGVCATTARADGAPQVDSAMKAEIQAEVKAALKAEQEKDKSAMKVAWKDTVTFESADKMFSGKLVGRLQVDYWTFPGTDENFENAIGDFWDSALFFRRARLGFELGFKKNTKVHIEYDFARGGTSQGFADTFIEFYNFGECGWALPDIYIGHTLECGGGFEQLSSDNYNMFMEYNLATSTFSPFRNNGIMLQKGFACVKSACNDKVSPFPRVTAQAGFYGGFSNNFADGVFHDRGADEFAGDQNGWAVDGRIVALPWVDCNCPECHLLHVGAYASYRSDLKPNNLRFSSRPEVGVGPRSIDTGADIVADHDLLVGAEALLLMGRFCVNGEYMFMNVSAPTQGDPKYWGAYVEASYFLTGDCRAYDLTNKVWARQKPCHPFYCGDCCSKGFGSWEVAARFSTVNLNDGDIAVQGGKEWDATVGLNWYINNNVKVMFNYVHADIKDRPTGANNVLESGTVDAFGVRVAASF
jgi:phosphate-selective porin OprO/OprP